MHISVSMSLPAGDLHLDWYGPVLRTDGISAREGFTEACFFDRHSCRGMAGANNVLADQSFLCQSQFLIYPTC